MVEHGHEKLTAWAAIIAVPTAITGYFGQNAPYPEQAAVTEPPLC